MLRSVLIAGAAVIAIACPGRPAPMAPVPSASGLAISIPRAPARTSGRDLPESSLAAVVIDRREVPADGQPLTIRDVPRWASDMQIAWPGARRGRVTSVLAPFAPRLGERVRVRSDEDITVGTLHAIDSDNYHIVTERGPTAQDGGAVLIKRSSVRDIRSVAVKPALSVERPDSAGEPTLMELSYRTIKLSWSASYRLRARADQDRIEVAIRPQLTIHNETGHSFPEADVELLDNRGARPLWTGRKALTDSQMRVPFGLAGTRDSADADEVQLTGRVQYIARLTPENYASQPGKTDTGTAIRRPPRVIRELILPLPDGHQLSTAPPGWARVRMAHAGRDDEHFEGPLTVQRDLSNSDDQPSGPTSIHVALGTAHDLVLTHRQTARAQARGTLYRHRLKLRNRGQRDVPVRIVASIPQARLGELLHAKPSPLRAEHDRMVFAVTAVANEDTELSYSLFYPH